MFIKKITISNFGLFPSEKNFEIDNINTPDDENEGSGLNVFVGENGSGKTTLLNAFVLPILEYKTEDFRIDDFNDTNKKVVISIYSKDEFEVAGTTLEGSFKAKGFSFEADVRLETNKTYLSSIIVNDQKFIKVDSLEPKDDSPDLRVNVNNPFKGKRFNENEVLFLDRNRLSQTRTGNFNTAGFDRLMEDLSHQYLKGAETEIANLNDDLNRKIKEEVKGNFLLEVEKKFQKISGLQIRLNFLDNYEPFKNAFFAAKKDNNQQISLSNLGSGYEMIFALLYSLYLAQQSEKQLIVLIDEPELHLHPRLQEDFVKFLLEFSKKAQIILASHSPLLVKQLSINENVKIRVIEKDGQEASEIEKRVLPYISGNEINFLAFNLATEEYYNELYEELKSIHGEDKKYKDFDNDFFVVKKGEPKNSPWKKNQNEISKYTFIRNQIHHQKENGKTKYDVLKSSIEKIRNFF